MLTKRFALLIITLAFIVSATILDILKLPNRDQLLLSMTFSILTIFID